MEMPQTSILMWLLRLRENGALNKAWPTGKANCCLHSANPLGASRMKAHTDRWDHSHDRHSPRASDPGIPLPAHGGTPSRAEQRQCQRNGSSPKLTLAKGESQRLCPLPGSGHQAPVTRGRREAAALWGGAATHCYHAVSVTGDFRELRGNEVAGRNLAIFE